MTDETTYKLFKAIEENSATSQLCFAGDLEIDLCKPNYCLKTLLDKGLAKAANFIEINCKRSDLY